jgi:hypothetical protein
MRRRAASGRVLLLSTLAALAALAIALPASAESTQVFRAEFRDVETGCPTGVDLCGKGVIQGFGTVTTTLTLTSFAPGPGANCVTATADRVVTLDSDGTSTLLLAVAGTICGHTAEATFTITSGTGVFAGATGGGTLSGVILPDPQGDAVQYLGTITLP